MACGYALTATSALGAPQTLSAQVEPAPPASHAPEAERRQLTVMFCDLMGSTELSGRLDPEVYRDLIRVYQATCAEVIQRFDGYIAQYLGDGLLVYFGYPVAHEDDAQRAVRAALGCLAEMETLNRRLIQDKGRPLAVRIGIHTGPVVVGDIGAGETQERLAMGATPNLAARLQGLAEPDTVVISATTFHLAHGYFECLALGDRLLRGMSAPTAVYRVVRPSGAQNRLDIAPTLTPLVGRESEVALLLERWNQAKAGQGQVVVMGGEAGIGKSRLVQVLKDHCDKEPSSRLECRSSPYSQNSALYPITDLLQRSLQWQPEESPRQKLVKLEQILSQYRLPLEETIPLFAALLSLPIPEEKYPPLPWTPQRQREKTIESLLSILLESAEREPVFFILEDLHWTDPTTLELLNLLIDQAPTSRLLALLTCRPTFQPPWSSRSYLTQMTLNSLSRNQIQRIAEHTARGKQLPAEVLEQLIEKTDGVPLIVEELTKAVLESGHLQEVDGRYELIGPLTSLTIPVTLQDALMARLDRLVTAKPIAQYAAVIGRQFSYDLLRAVLPLDETTLRRELGRLVEAELVYQRGLPPQATYLFKHALVVDAAYASLLKSTLQQYHQQIAQVMEAQFAEVGEAQPELLARHYTEADLTEPAIRHWRRAGDQAAQRSAHTEAIGHLTKALELLLTLPDTPGRAQQELALQLSLGASLMVTKGYSATEVEQLYTRQQELCFQVGDAFQVAQVLFGLYAYYVVRGHFTAWLALGEQFLTFAQQRQDAAVSFMVHTAVGGAFRWTGDFVSAHTHLEKAFAFYDRNRHLDLTYYIGQDPGLCALTYAAESLWCRGYPDQALERAQHALSLAQALSHPFSLADTLGHVALLHLLRHERQDAQTHIKALLPLAHEHGFAWWVGIGTCLQGWALIESAVYSSARELGEAGLEQLREGLDALQAIEAEIYVPQFLGVMAQGYGQVDQASEGLRVVAEALALAEKNSERCNEAELHRLKGELTLAREGQSQPAKDESHNVEKPNARAHIPESESEVEASFLKAIEIAQKQQAKSWELRAAMSLARLWRSQGKRQDAVDLLAPVYNWFTEGFDTADLIDAKMLLEELGEARHDL